MRKAVKASAGATHILSAATCDTSVGNLAYSGPHMHCHMLHITAHIHKPHKIEKFTNISYRKELMPRVWRRGTWIDQQLKSKAESTLSENTLLRYIRPNWVRRDARD